MLKNFTSCALICAFVLCLNPIARAESVEENIPEETISSSQNLARTEFSNIYLTPSDDYVMRCNANSFISVGRLDINLLNDTEYQQALQNPDIPIEVKEALSEKRELAIEDKHPSNVSFFSPDLVDNSNTATANSEEIYEDYDGHQMKSVLLSTAGCSSKYQTVEDGKDAYRAAKSITDIVFTMSEDAQEIIPIVGKGMSLFDAFMDLFGDAVIYGNSGDYVQVRVEYDETDQWTYGKIGSTWTLGLMTHEAIITEIDVFQHFYDSNANRYQNKHEYPDGGRIASPHFDDPWETAWKAVGYVENEIITFSMYNKTWLL